MSTVQTASEQIVEEVGAWPGVSVGAGKRGASVAFHVGRRELGHLHGDRSLHLSLPPDEWDALLAQGRIAPHPVFPDRRGPAARRIESDADVRDVIALLRINYERALERQ